VSETTAKIQRKIKCIVTSDKMVKSRVAKIERLVQDKVTKKYVKKTTKLMFHDEENQSKQGDLVLVVQTKPISANKKFALHSVVHVAK
jgi:small subunit ribosomal protein S17